MSHSAYTLINVTGGTATKTISKHGKTAAGFWSGTAHARTVVDAAELAQVVGNMTSKQVLCWGLSGEPVASIATERAITAGTAPAGAISRSKAQFSWPRNGAIMSIDCDDYAIGVDSLLAALYSAVPALFVAPMVITRSSSHGVYDSSDGDSQPTEGGIRVLVLVDDGRQIERVANVLYQRLWLAGHGSHVMNASIEHPAVLERCIIDKAMFQTNRLDYLAAPICVAPMARITPIPTVINNDQPPLEMSAVHDLTPAEIHTFNTLVSDSKAKLKPTVRKAQAQHLKALPKTERKQARKRQMLAGNGKLAGTQQITLTDGRVVTVSQVLADPAQYDRCTTLDPLEPDYRGGAQVGILYLTDGNATLYSQAHGGTQYELLPATTTLADAYEVRALRQPSTPEDEQVMLMHVKQKGAVYGHYKPRGKVRQFDTMPALADYVLGTPHSVAIQAKLGSGKSSEVVARLVDLLRKLGRPLAVVTNLKSLSTQIVELTGTTHYGEAMVMGADQITTTIHSLYKMNNCIAAMRKEDGAIIIDEFSSVAEILFSRDSQLSPGDRHNTLKILAELAAGGTRFVLLDAHNTPAGEQLKKLLGIRESIECQQTQYPDPAIIAYPVQSVESADTGKTVKSAPLLARIGSLLQDGETVSVATDSANQATSMGLLLQPMAERPVLVLTKDTVGEADQAAFIADPEGEINKYSAIIYSPVLNCGFSCITPVYSFAFLTSGVLSPTGNDQLIRRFRNTVGNEIKISFANRALNCQSLGDFPRIDFAEYGDYTGLVEDAVFDLAAKGLQAVDATRCSWQAQPFYATVGHWINYGYQVSFEYDTTTAGSEEIKQARKEVKAATVQRIFDAPDIDDQTADTLKDKATLAASAKVARHRFINELAIESDQLTVELIEKCEHGKLLKQIEQARVRAEWLAGSDFGLIDKKQRLINDVRHFELGLNVVDMVINRLTNADGAIVFTGRQCIEIVAEARQMVGRRLSVYGVPRLPRKDAKQRNVTAWITELLTGFGIVRISSERPDDERIYTHQECEIIGRFVPSRLSSLSKLKRPGD